VRALMRAWWPHALVAAVVVLLRLPTLTNRILSIDEASYLVHALRLQSLEAFVFAFLYRTEVKTQVGLVPYLLANALDRSNAIFLIHLFGLVAAAISCSLMILLAKRLLKSELAGVAAALVWAVYLVVGPGSPDPQNLDRYNFFQAPRLEYFQVPFLLLSLYWFMVGVEAQRVARNGNDNNGRAIRLLGGAGAAWAFACLVKPSSVLFGIPMLITLPFFWTVDGGGKAKLNGLLKAGMVFIGSAALPVLLVFAPYLFHPAALGELWLNLAHVSSSYATEGLSLSERLAELLTGFQPLLLGAFLLVPIALAMQQRSFRATRSARAITQAWLCGVALFLGVVQGQAHLYYLIVVIPFMALAVSGQIASLLGTLAATGRIRFAQAIALVGVLIYMLPQITALSAYPGETLKDAYLGRDRRRFDLDGLVSYIRTQTPPNGTLWVYFNTPELLVLSERLPVTRDPAGIWLVVLWEEPWFQRTADELAAECPHLIIGIDRPRYHYPHTSPLLEIPKVGEWIARTYVCDDSAFRGAIVCRLEQRPSSCKR